MCTNQVTSRYILSKRQTALSTAGNYRCDPGQPSLFLLCINDLQLTDPKNKAVFIITRNIFPFDSHPSKELTEAIMQEAITKVIDWSSRHKLILNVNRHAVFFFTKSRKGPAGSSCYS